ncbi:MAG: hypothetical protein AB7M12_02440 [Hyphomonadaceae bacterium]
MHDARTIAIETAERDALADLYAAAPPRVREALGLSARRLDDGLLIQALAVDQLDLNRLVGFGIAQLPRGETLDAALDALGASGLKEWGVAAVEGDAALQTLGEARGLAPRKRVWMKFTRAPTPAPVVDTQLAVREVQAANAEAFGVTAAAGFGMPPIIGGWLSALPGRPNWRCFAAFDGAAPVAAGAVYLAPRAAWFGFGATLPSYRGRRAQPAILAARIEAARLAGSPLLSTETGIPFEGEAAPSFNNIQRAGFAPAYRRANLQRL